MSTTKFARLRWHLVAHILPEGTAFSQAAMFGFASEHMASLEDPRDKP